MTDHNVANDSANGSDTIALDEDALRDTIKSALEEGGLVYREVEVADGITVTLDWDTDARILPVGIGLNGDSIPETVADDLGNASAALDGLQADIDGVFYEVMEFDKRDYGNRARYELVHNRAENGYVCYDGHIFNPSSTAAPA